MLDLSEVLITPSHEAIVRLVNNSNDARIQKEQVSTTFGESEFATQSATLTALTVATDGAIGRYRGSVTVKYERPTVNRLLPDTPVFNVVIKYPFTFNELKTVLLNTYGLVLEERDIREYREGSNWVSPTFEFNQSYPNIVDNQIHLYIHPGSPRFCPSDTPGFRLRVLSETGTELDLLVPTTLLDPLTSLDN
jgi:hypothetical protein